MPSDEFMLSINDRLYRWINTSSNWAPMLAALFAGVAVVTTALQLRILWNDRIKTREDERKRLASQFAVWLTTTNDGKQAKLGRNNRGGLPMYTVIVWLCIDEEKPILIAPYPLLGPSNGSDPIVSSEIRLQERSGKSNKELLALRGAGRALVKVQFRDCTDRYWCRRKDGQLVEILRDDHLTAWRQAVASVGIDHEE